MSDPINHECDNTEVNVVELPAGLAHTHKKMCKVCNKFVGWSNSAAIHPKRAPPDPAIEIAHTERLHIIRDITPYATKWEKNFCQSIYTHRTLTPKQQEVWDKMCKTYREVGVIN